MDMGQSTSGTSEERVKVYNPKRDHAAQMLLKKQAESQKPTIHKNIANKSDNGESVGYVPKLLRELEKRRSIMKISHGNSLGVVLQLVNSACDYGRAAKVLKINGSKIILKTAKSLTKSSIMIPSKVTKYKPIKLRKTKSTADNKPQLITRVEHLEKQFQQLFEAMNSEGKCSAKYQPDIGIDPPEKKISEEPPSKPNLSSDASSYRSFQSSGHEPMDV